MPLIIAPIVEGHGKIEAIRPLIYNIVASQNGLVYPTIMRPYRISWGSLVNRPEELTRSAQVVLLEGGPSSRLLVLLDADERCPALLGPELLQHLIGRFPETLVSVSVADWEYESWFIASAESIAEYVGGTLESEVPDNIEVIQNAKGWLERNVLNRRYKETRDQAALSSAINVPLARQRWRSFNRLCLELERLLTRSLLAKRYDSPFDNPASPAATISATKPNRAR